MNPNRIQLQTIGWADVLVNESRHIPDSLRHGVDDPREEWMSTYPDIQKLTDEERELVEFAYELGCQAWFEHGEHAQGNLEEMIPEVLQEHGIPYNQTTNDAFRGGFTSMLN